MTRLVAVDKEALDKVIRHLRGHANFKRHGHMLSRSTEGADQIDALADSVEKQYEVHMSLSQSPKACEVNQHVFSDNEGICIYCEAPMLVPRSSMDNLPDPGIMTS